MCLRGDQIICRYKYPLSTDGVLHGVDHQNVTKKYLLSYYLTISPDICFVTLWALSETMLSIWFDVDINYLAACQVLFCAPGGNYQDF